MTRLSAFIQRHLDPADRLGEILFGLIMALGFTAAVRIGTEAPNNRELFIAILGCNLAWGVVDGVMFAMLALFERGRKSRIIEAVLNAPTEKAAIARIAEELDDRLESLTTPDERGQIYHRMLDFARRTERERTRLLPEDILGGIAVGLVILLATLPILVPFLVIEDSELAVRLSNLIALALLFWLGSWWGHTVGARPLRVAAGVTLVGLILVSITILLGG
jgi:VIT1/CCC1 family predicted Fe2+/Mn2+ transporter